MRNPPLFLVGNTTLNVIQTTEEGYLNGRPVPGTQTTVPVVCNVQPVLKFSDTLSLPEADRSKACLKIYTQGGAMNQIREGRDGFMADRFVWEGDLYQVMKSIHYAVGPLNHYKVICMRVELT